MIGSQALELLFFALRFRLGGWGTIEASMCLTIGISSVVAKPTAVNGGDRTKPLYRCFVQCFRTFDHLRSATAMHTLSPEGRKSLSVSPSRASTNRKDNGRHSGRVILPPSQLYELALNAEVTASRP